MVPEIEDVVGLQQFLSPGKGGGACMHASEMYLVTLVNATFVGRRPAGHLELVDLSVEKKTVEQRYNDKKQQQLRTHHGGADDHAASAADLCMQPLFPLFLGSPTSSSDSSSEADTRERQILQLESKPQPVPFKQPDQGLDRLFPSDKGVDRADVDTLAMKTIKPSRARVAPKLESLFSDGGISTRVQRHPLEMIAEQEHRDGDSDSSPSASIRNTSAAPVLPHPLARVDERPVKVSSVKKNLENERKPATMRKEPKSSTAIPAPAPNPVRKVVRAAKPQPQWREQRRVPITKPTTRSNCPKPRSCPQLRVPGEPKQPAAVTDSSLANPVMERMPQIASPEPAYAWSKKLPNLPKLEVTNMDIEDPDQLRYSSPKMTEWDAQDDLSFRVWERESNPKRKSISVSRDFQDSLDLEDVVDQPTLPGTTTQSNFPPGRKTTKPTATDLRRNKKGAEVEPECPSPSSFTCGLSSTSLFSDEEEEDEDVGEAEFNRRSFSTFIYSDLMDEVTSSDDGAESPELRYFQEAGHREPWLDGAAVLDDTDLQFLLKDDSPVPEISIEDVVISTAAMPSASHVRRHSRSSSLSKPKRSVRFAPELVRKMSAPRTSIRLPPLPNAHDDEQIYPSVKSWEVDDDEDTSVASSTASTPRRTRWRRSPSSKPPADAATSRPRWRRPCGKCDADQVRRRDQILPCAGRLFSWPQRLAFGVSRSRRLDVSTDDESVVAGFGPARRDISVHHKNVAVAASNLRVADLLDDNFASR